MSRLIDSIRLFNGKFSRLDLHQGRVDNSFRSIYNADPKWRLESLLETEKIPGEGLYKCRVVYDDKAVQIEFIPYKSKPVKTLKLLRDDNIVYDHKWENRSELNATFALRGSCDDILIVKNGLITDTLYANIVFGKNGKWYTPQSYLLQGTMRQYLLKNGVIEKRVISGENFREYDQFKLVNAMLEWDGPANDVSNIY